MPTSQRGRSLPNIKAFYTVAELAARWIVSERQVRRFIETGELKATRFRRMVRIAAAEVALFEARAVLTSITDA